MKLTKTKLKQIIKEEIFRTLKEKEEGETEEETLSSEAERLVTLLPLINTKLEYVTVLKKILNHVPANATVDRKALFNLAVDHPGVAKILSDKFPGEGATEISSDATGPDDTDKLTIFQNEENVGKAVAGAGYPGMTLAGTAEKDPDGQWVVPLESTDGTEKGWYSIKNLNIK